MPANALLVEKSRIAENGDYNLSGDRYKIDTKQHRGKYVFVELSDVAIIRKGNTITKKDSEEGNVPVIAGGQQPAYFHNESNRKGNVITVSASGAYAGFINFFNTPIFASDCSTIEVGDVSKINIKFLYYVLKSKQDDFYKFQIGGGQPHVYPSHFSNYKIPLPPLSIQQEIVSKIEQYEKIIAGAKQIVENYKPQIDIRPEWEMVELGKIFKLSSGRGLTQQNMVEGEFPVYGGNGINGYHNEYFIENPTIVIGRVGAYCGSVIVTQPKSWVTDNGLYVTEYLIEINQDYLAQVLSQLELNKYAKVGGQPSISQSTVYERQIPIPTLVEQELIVAQIEKEQQLVNANKELIKIYDQKIKDEINKLWSE